MERLTRMYDGYHFNYRDMVGVYNPFSILNVLDTTMFDNFWFASGTPTFLVEILKKTDFDLRELDGIEVSAVSLTDDRADINNPVPMIYQSGYLTIKKYDNEFQIYTLGFPNEEVKYGFLNFVTPFYTPIKETDTSFYIGKFIRELREGYPDAPHPPASFLCRNLLRAERPHGTSLSDHFLPCLQAHGTILRCRSAKCQRTSRCHLVKTADYIYVFEFKLDGSAEQALAQIDDRGYLIPYTVDGRKLMKIGVNFDPKERNIGDWKIN